MGQATYLQKAKKTYNSDSSVFYTEHFLNWAISKKDTAQYIDGAFFMAKIYLTKSSFSKAEKLLEKCLSYSFSKKNKIYLCKIQIELGSLYRSIGEYSTALMYYQKAIIIAEVIFAWREMVVCETQMAEYFRALSKYREANFYINSALKKYEKHRLNDTSLLISIYNRAAAIDNESNPQINSTIKNSRKALALALSSKNLEAQAISLNELGFTYKNLRKIGLSETLYKKAEKIWFSVGAYPEAMHTMNNRIMLYSHNNYPPGEIADLYLNMIQIVTSKKIDYALNDAYSFLSNYYSRTGDSLKAFRFFNMYHNSIVKEIRKQNDIQIVNMTERYESEKAKKQVKKVEGELIDSKEKLEQKTAENTTAYIFVLLLVVLLGAIVFLLVRINNTNKKLRERNVEKDVLIQEIHHRVKNNLQFISSLVNMQMNSSSNDAEIHSLSDASRRIKAMALVHEMLYNQKETEGIEVKQYLEELIASLNDVVNSDKIPIKFTLNLCKISFNVSNSIALGMITSELVSNSMKHAFNGIEKPEIKIQLKIEEKNQVLFTVQDNGNGYTDIVETRKTLGMRLIDIFSRQLKGMYQISNKIGCEYKIKFTLK